MHQNIETDTWNLRSFQHIAAQMIPACSKKMEKDLFIPLGCFLDFASKTAQNHPKPIHLQFQETKGVMKGDFPLQIPKLRNRTIGKLSLLSIHLRFCNTKGVLTLALPFSIRPLICTCIYVYMYICVYVYMYICIYVYVKMRILCIIPLSYV